MIIPLDRPRKLIRREPLKHDRVPSRRLRNPHMTVCTASTFFCLYDKDTNDFGGAVIAASDRRLSDAGLGIGYQGSRWKGAAFPAIKQLVLVSGDIAIHSAIIRELTSNLTNLTPTTLEMAEMVAELIRKYRMVEATRLFLAPLNLNHDSFLDQQRVMEPTLVRELAKQLINHKIDAEVLIAGCDGEKEANLYRVDSDGLVTCHTDIGFVSIGSGGIHSSAYFMTLPYSHSVMYFHALYHTFVAKKKAEVDPYVDSFTDMFLIARDGVEKIVPETIAELEKIYAERMEREKNFPEEAAARLAKVAAANIPAQPPKPPAEVLEKIGDVADIP
jgi:hypothetical protein